MENDKLYNYLFLNSTYPYKNKWFKSLIIKLDSVKDIDSIVSVFVDLMGEVKYIINGNEIILLYFNEIDFSLEEVALSLSSDFGINILIFNMFKLYTDENKFLDIYNLYLKYLSNKHQGYFEMSDLILEVVGNNSDSILLKEMVLERILNDSQNETLINAMFKNDLNVLKTSKKIYMHRNTINNRLDLIKKETGLNIQKFQDAVAMYSLLKIK